MVIHSRHNLFFAVLTVAIVGSATSGSGDSQILAPSFVGAVSIVSETSIETFNSAAFGEPIRSPVPDGFPGPACTTCAPEGPTEYRDFESGVCVKITDDSIGIVANNATLLSSHSLARNPLYFHKLDSSTFVILYDDFYYQFLYERENIMSVHGDPRPAPSPGNPISVVVVEAGDGNGYLVELVDDDGYVDIYTYDLSFGHSFSGFDGYYSCLDLYELQPAFSPGLFFLNCRNNSGRTHFQCSVDSHMCKELDLCNDPFPSPSGDNGHASFATACGDTLTVYNMSNSTQQSSTSYLRNISSMAYLDKNTLLVDMGSQQHLLNVDTLIRNSSAGFETTLDNTDNCSLLRKLVTQDVYATACKNGSLYEVRFLNKRNGQELLSLTNLTNEPVDVYFYPHEQPVSADPMMTPPYTQSSSAMDLNTLMPSTPYPTETLSEMSSTMPPLIIPSSTSLATVFHTEAPNSNNIDHSIYILISIVGAAIVVFLVIVIVLFIALRRRKKRKSRSCDFGSHGSRFSWRQSDHPVEEENPHTYSLPRIYTCPNPFQVNTVVGTHSLSTSGYSSTNSSTTFTHPVSDTQPHTLQQT